MFKLSKEKITVKSVWIGIWRFKTHVKSEFWYLLPFFITTRNFPRKVRLKEPFRYDLSDGFYKEMLFLRRERLYQILGWPGTWHSTTLLWKWWDIMQKTEVSELGIQMDWLKTLIWAGWNPRCSAWISKIVDCRGQPFNAWPIRAYNWYFSIWFWKVRIGLCIQTSTSFCERWPVFGHDEVSHVINHIWILASVFKTMDN